MRARVAALFTALLTAAGMLVVSAPGPALAQAPFPGSAAFSGYSTGTAVHADRSRERSLVRFDRP